jgi:hypothetical protein
MWKSTKGTKYKSKPKSKVMSPQNSDKLKAWVKAGCPAKSKTLLQRPSAQECPNTFVILWNDPQGLGLPVTKIWLDVHYKGNKIEPGKELLALGGFWATGIEGALKPEQDTDLLFKNMLLAETLNESPELMDIPVYGKY